MLIEKIQALVKVCKHDLFLNLTTAITCSKYLAITPESEGGMFFRPSRSRESSSSLLSDTERVSEELLDRSFESSTSEVLGAATISEPIPLPYYPLRFNTDNSSSIVSRLLVQNIFVGVIFFPTTFAEGKKIGRE